MGLSLWYSISSLIVVYYNLTSRNQFRLCMYKQLVTEFNGVFLMEWNFEFSKFGQFDKLLKHELGQLSLLR